jgi:hypothetical protein
MRGSLFVVTLALAACGQNVSQPASTASAPETPSEFTLTCADFALLTPETLVRRFGAENISTQIVRGPEDESYEATIVYAEDPTRQLEIVWNDARSAPGAINVKYPGTQWRGAEGYTIGTPIAEIERINVMPFKLWGFGWDHGGWVSDWNVGTLSQSLVPGCRPRIRFDARTDPSAVSGDSEFNSNDPAMRAADPAVSEFGLLISAP